MSRSAKLATSNPRCLAAGLLILYGAMAWSSVREKSTTFDEIAHLTAGYSYWLTGDYRLHPENGNLPQRWATLPLLVQGVRFPSRDGPSWWQANVWELGHEFFYQLENDLGRMLWWARGMIVLLGIALGVAVYTWSRQLFGPLGGLVALVTYAFSPACLAHGRLATSDLTATLMFVASLGCLWIAAHRVSAANVLVSAVAMGLLFVSKTSAVLIVPIGLVLVAIRVAVGRPLVVCFRGRRIIRSQGQQLLVLAAITAIHAMVVVATIWSFYGFRYETFRDAQADRDQMFSGQTIESLTEESSIGPPLRWANDHHLLPEAYLHGLAYTVKMVQARSAFLNGEYSIYGWKSFFPYSFLVKTPLATFVVLLAAMAAAAARWHSGDASRHQSTFYWRRVRKSFYRAAPIWVFLAIYWAVAIFTRLNIGHRHILPTYPLAFILCGAAGYWIDRRHKAAAVLVLLALAELIVESVAIYPHYLAYFNQLVGGPSHGYRHLVDSSLDWGQDLAGLARWLDERPDAAQPSQPVYLSYFGTGDAEFYGIQAGRLPSYMDWRSPELATLRAGIYCVSATMLQCVYVQPPGPWTAELEGHYWVARKAVDGFYSRQQQDPEFLQRLSNDPNSTKELARWNTVFSVFDRLRFARLCAYLRLREPDDSVGYSILIYRLDDRDVDLAVNQRLDQW